MPENNTATKKRAATEDSTETKKRPIPKKRTNSVLCIMFAIVWAVAAVIASQYVVGYIMVWMMGAEAFSKPAVTAVYSALSYTVALLLVVFIPRKLFAKWGVPSDYKKLIGIHKWPTWTDIGLAPVGFIIYLLLASFIVWLFSLFPWFDVNQAQDVGFNLIVSSLDRVVAFLTLVVVAPIAEELIFRGWLYGTLRNRTSTLISNTTSMITSSLLVSVLFGIVHLQWNVGVNVFALSLILCALREITGTVHAGIFLHMLKNGVAFWMLYMM